MPERPLPYRPPELEDFGKPSRVERGQRRERERRQGSDPVPSRAVHQRGQESAPSENPETVRLKSLMGYIVHRSDVLFKLSDFLDSKGYKDTEGTLVDSVKKSLAQAREIAESYLADDSKDAPTEDDFVRLEEINTQFFTEIGDLKEAIETLESQKKITVPDEIKALFDEPVPPAAPEDPVENNSSSPGGGGDVRREQRELPTFEQDLAQFESDFAEWKDLRKEIHAEGSPERLTKDLEGLEERVFGSGRFLREIEDTIAFYHESLEAGKQPGRGEKDWLARHAHGLREVIAAGRTIRNQILKERGIEQEKIVTENETKQAAIREEKKEDSPLGHEKSFAELKGRIEAWDEMYKVIVAAKRDKRLSKELRRTKERFLLEEKTRGEIDAHLDKLQSDLQAGKKIGRSEEWINRHRYGFDRLILVGERILQEPASAQDKNREGETKITVGDIWEAPAKDSRYAGRRVVITEVLSDDSIKYQIFDIDAVGNAENMGFGYHDRQAGMNKWLAEEGFTYKGREEARVTPVVEAKGKVVVLATGREVRSDAEITAWEKVSAEKARAFKTRIGTDEMNDFQGKLKQRLIAAGVNDSILRQRAAAKALDDYMPRRIRQLAAMPEWNFVITDEEIEKVFMEGLSLRKNLFVS